MTRNNKEDFSKFRAEAPDLSFANRLFSFWSKVVTMCYEFLRCLLSHVTQKATQDSKAHGDHLGTRRATGTGL